MGRKSDLAINGLNLTVKLVVSALWAAGAVACFAAGVWWAGLVAIAYLLYLWVLGGRWLIY